MVQGGGSSLRQQNDTTWRLSPTPLLTQAGHLYYNKDRDSYKSLKTSADLRPKPGSPEKHSKDDD